ncbi:MAG: carboxylating nicotinate-nucleotide diphosphorylase [Bacteroidota bacterium]
MDQFQIGKQQILDFIKQGLHEDVQDGDHTSLACIPADARSKARLLVKDHGIIAGIELAEMIFKYVDPDCTIDIRIKDGQTVSHGDEAFFVECNSQALLKAERLILNSMQRMSGIATMTDRFVSEVEGLPVKLLDTRKTTPLIRFLEKWAVKIGGGTNYRHGLYDWIMIKDNHIDACGSITEAINRTNAYLKENNLDLGITIEVRNLEELNEVLEVGNVSRIMLDNFDIPIQKLAVEIIDGRFETEASGGVNIQTVGTHANTGVDFISIGALTHSPQSLDMSLKVIKD